MHRLTALLLALVVVLIWPLGMHPAVQANPCDPMLARRLLVAGGGSSFTIPANYPPADASWTRSGSNPILVASEAEEGGASGWVLEPTVLYESGFKMWYTGGVSGTGTEYSICYATSSNGVSWTKYASNPVLGKGGSGYAGVASRGFVFKVGSTYHMYFGNGTDLLHSTSSDGLTWATPTTVITAASVGGGATQMTNSCVWQESANDWRMLIEIVGGSTWFDRIGYATSADGLSWTMQNGGLPLASLLVVAAPDGASCAPFLIKKGSTYHLWYHANPGTPGLPQDGYHSTSTDLINWTTPTVVATHQGSGTFEYDQFADLSPIVVAGTAYLFYTGANNTTNEGGPWFKIGVATAPAVP